MVQARDVGTAAELCETAYEEGSEDGGEHDPPACDTGPEKDDGAEEYSDDAGLSDRSGNYAYEHVPETGAVLGSGIGKGVHAVTDEGERGGACGTVHEGLSLAQGNPGLGTGHAVRVREEQEGAGEERGVPNVHAGTAEDFLAEDDGEGNGDCEHPERNVDGDDQRDEETGDEVSFVHFLTADLGGGELDGQTYDVGYDEQRKDLEETEPEVGPETRVGSCGEGMLIAGVPHTEQGCGNGGDHCDDHYALEVDGIPDVGSLAGYGARYVEKCLESVDGRVKPVKLAAFFKYLVHITFFKPFP